MRVETGGTQAAVMVRQQASEGGGTNSLLATGFLPAPKQLRLDIESLVLDGSPRLKGEVESHTRLLSETAERLPPILVHRETMQVIDGVHRVQAARLRGERTIEAIFFEGDEAAAFVQAVKENVAHGLPLSLADRRAAAQRIVTLYPEWSDRAVAAATGLSAKTARAVRDRMGGTFQRNGSRVGRDGRSRPLDAADGRRRAAAAISDRPSASLREIADAAGVSVGTARDVRQRLSKGEDPVPNGSRRHEGSVGMFPRVDSGSAAAAGRTDRNARLGGSRPLPVILDDLKRDPSLRYSESGRGAIRWLSAHVMDSGEWSRVVDALPAHCLYVVADFAHGCARAWERAARELAERARAS